MYILGYSIVNSSGSNTPLPFRIPEWQRDIGRSVADEENSCLFANNCETVRSSGWRCDRRLKVTAFYGRYWLGFSWAKMAELVLSFPIFFFGLCRQFSERKFPLFYIERQHDHSNRETSVSNHWFFLGGVWYSYYENFGTFPICFIETSNWSRGLSGVSHLLRSPSERKGGLRRLKRGRRSPGDSSANSVARGGKNLGMQGFPEMAGEMWDIFGWMYHEI